MDDQIFAGGKMKDLNDLRSKGGHMALRNNVWDVRQQLWYELLPFEMQMIDVIIEKTIKWRVKEAKITLQQFMEITKKNRSWVYETLSSLEKKGIILRTRKNRDVYIGLNEDYFGGLLIKQHEEALLARKKKIKMVVDNSEKRPPLMDNSSATDGQFERQQRTQSPLPADTNDTQPIEIIEQPRSLNTLLKDIKLNTLLKESKTQESFTLSKEGNGELTQDQIESRRNFLRAQIASIK